MAPEAEKKASPIKDYSAPPTPTSIPAVAPFTSQDTINLHAAPDRKDDDISLIVHADDDAQFDLDNDLLATPSQEGDKGDAASEAGSKDKDSASTAHSASTEAKPATSTDKPAATGTDAGSKPATDAKKTEEKASKGQESKEASKTTTAAKRFVCICQ